MKQRSEIKNLHNNLILTVATNKTSNSTNFLLSMADEIPCPVATPPRLLNLYNQTAIFSGQKI